MAFLNFLYRNGLWISPPLFVASVAMLVFTILSVIRLGERKRLFSVPLQETQNVDFTETGRVVLCIEGPLLSRRFSGLRYELSTEDGERITGWTRWFHAHSSSFSKARMEMLGFTIPIPGGYVVSIHGLGESQAADAKHQIVFMKPHLIQAMGHVLGIVFAGIILIGSVVLFGLRLSLGEAGT